MASRALPLLPCLDAMEPERPPPPLLSELLEEIFLRVASPADLARVAAACVSFRSLISSASFLRRYRSAHPPPLLGFLSRAGFHQVEATHPSAAVARAADFSFDFLPPPRRWYPWHVCHGRVLAARRRRDVKKLDTGEEHPLSLDLAVCDALTQRYLLLPPLTDDLLASVGLQNQDMFNSDASLIPSGDTEEETSFSVICCMFSKTRFVVFVFSTSSAHWVVGTSVSWVDLGLYEEVISLISGQCVYGCLYWEVNYRNKLLKLDINTMELSTYDLPPDHEQRSIAIVESGEGRVAMFSADDEGAFLEYYTFMQNGTDQSCKWHLKSTIPFPVHSTSSFFISDQAEGYVFLTHIIEEQDTSVSEFFSLEVKSCNLERACRTSASSIAHPYFGFPPSMSPRRIEGYGELLPCGHVLRKSFFMEHPQYSRNHEIEKMNVYLLINFWAIVSNLERTSTPLGWGSLATH